MFLRFRTQKSVQPRRRRMDKLAVWNQVHVASETVTMPNPTFPLECNHTCSISENDLLNRHHALPAIQELTLVDYISRLTASAGDKHALIPKIRVLEISWFR